MTPFAPAKACRAPGCPGFQVSGGYCHDHQDRAKRYTKEQAKAYNKKRGTTTEQGYGANWQKVRRYVLSSQPLCYRCNSRGTTTPATLVHHDDNDSHNNALNNLQSLCRDCHERVHGRKG